MNVTGANALEGALGDRQVPLTVDYKHDPSGATMKALVWHGNRDVRVEDVPKPVVTDPKDALVKVGYNVGMRSPLGLADCALC